MAHDQAVLLSKTLDKLYAAALDPAQWREALVGVEEFTGSTGAVIDLIPLSPATRPMTFAGSFSNEDCTEYALNYQSICPRIAFAIAHPEVSTHFDQLVLTETEMDRDPVYEWFGKHGLRYYVAGRAGRTKFYQAYASLQRSRKQGHVGKEDIARFEIIRPHLVQALTLADTLGTLSSHRRFSSALLDALPQALFGLADDGAVVFTNDSAERLLARATCLGLRAGRLVTADPSQQTELDKVLACAVAETGTAARARLLIRPRGGGLPYAARVNRLIVNEFDHVVRPAILLIINDAESFAELDGRALHELYGLTGGETRLAAALLQGHSLHSASYLLGSSIETLRCHLKSIFRKVGVSRQQDLVRVLTELEMSSITRPEPCSSPIATQERML